MALEPHWLASLPTFETAPEELVRRGVTGYGRRIGCGQWRWTFGDELRLRRYATGSFRDRFPDLPDGHVFDDLVFEIFEKDDATHDPLLVFDFEAGVLRRHVPNNKAAEAIGTEVSAGDRISEEPLAQSRFADATPDLIARLRSLTLSAFEVIEEA